MVAEKKPHLVPASYLEGASCLLERVGPVSDWPMVRSKTGPTVETLLSCLTPADRPSPSLRPGKTPNFMDELSKLTPAEKIVAIHVAQGLSNKEISSALGRAEATIKHQLSSTIRKLGLQSRCQLIVRLLT